MPLGALSVEKAADALSGQALALEFGGGRIDEKALFHTLNLARQKSAHVLITAADGPEAWGLQLPDLISRLKALPVIPILPPDDVLLRNVLVKLFGDRQIHVEESVVGYLLLRMPRSLAAARQLVAEIDRRALAEKAEVTRPFVAKVLAESQNPDLFTP
jgi:chromosomal replication initiation ATPase DnaA